MGLNYTGVLASYSTTKAPKLSHARELCCKLPKIRTKMPNLKILCQKDANGIANSEDPDQTAPLGAVRSGSAFFANTYPPKNLGSLRYLNMTIEASWRQCQQYNLCAQPPISTRTSTECGHWI